MVDGAIEKRRRVGVVQIPALQPAPTLRRESHVHGLVALHLGFLRGIRTLLPDVVVRPLSLRPHELERELAVLAFAVVVEGVQDAVVGGLGVTRVHAEPLARGLLERMTGLPDEQLPGSLWRVWCRYVMVWGGSMCEV